MLKEIAFGALILCTNVFLRASCDLEKPTIIQDLVINASNSSTVAFNGYLYTVSKNSSHIHVNSTDSNYKTCDVAIDPAKDVMKGRLEVTSTDDEIFIVGVRNVKTTEIDRYKSESQYEYTILRVDPKTCSYQSVSIPEINDDSNGEYYFPRIVKHRGGSDIFFPKLKSCAPCRVNNVGLRSEESTSQIQAENTRPKSSLVEQYHVQYVDPMNAYFYVYDSHDYSNGAQITKLKLLDSNDFKTLKERNINFSVETISRQKKSAAKSVGVCTKTYDRRLADIIAYTDVRCDILNSNLDTTNTIRIPIGDHRSERISSLSYEFDEEGNSYISFAQETGLRLYIHDKDGKLVKAFDMGEIDEKFKQYPTFNPLYFNPYSYWNVNGFLVGDQYCIVTKQSPSHYSTPVHQVRCIAVTKYIKP